VIPALVLTAGLATRQRPLSYVRAKAVLPVAGQPLACRILRWLAQAGITTAVLNLHHLPQTVTGAIGDGSALGLRVRYSWEVPVLGSAGGPRRALPLLFDDGMRRGTSQPFLIVNGDTLTDADLPALITAHRTHDALVTMAVVPNTEPERYGGVVVDPDGAVRGFVRRGSRESSYHFFGVQVAESAAFASVPEDVPYETVATLYPALIAARPGSIRAFRCDAEYLDIGTPADYLRTSLLVAAREGGTLAGSRCRVDRSARIQDSILWDDVVVEEGAFLRECVVTDGACVPADTSWHGVTIRRGTGELAPGERRIGDLAIASM
jgi:mannose-1-phosphate guanylyltransferase/mannose-1-phosphate guanylyltransferase/phosphomannomutase